MSKGIVIAIVILGLMGFVAVGVVGTVVSIYNSAVEMDTRVDRGYRNLQNVLSQYSLQIVEMAQISDKYKTDMVELVSGTLAGRYGENGSKAMFQWIQEQNPTLDPTIYTRMQVLVESGRNKFQNEQKLLLDVCGEYKAQLNYLVTGTVLRVLGFPKMISLEKHCTPIQSNHAQRTFETGIDEGIKVFQ